MNIIIGSIPNTQINRQALDDAEAFKSLLSIPLQLLASLKDQATDFSKPPIGLKRLLGTKKTFS